MEPNWQDIVNCKDNGVITTECKDISGIAKISEDGNTAAFIVVRGKERKFGKITVNIKNPHSDLGLELFPLPSEVVGDLESISAIPGPGGEFIIVSDKGIAFYVRLTNKNILEFKGTINLPGYENKKKDKDSTEIEGVAVQKIGEEFVIMWATRGKNNIGSKLFLAKLNLDGPRVSITDQSDYSFINKDRALLGSEEVRHVSDIKIDTKGNVYVSSANDPGNPGPFSSAVYLIGKVARVNNKYEFNNPVQNLVASYYAGDQLPSKTKKIEGLEILSDGTFVFGTDDENHAAKLLVVYSAAVPNASLLNAALPILRPQFSF